MLRTSNVLRVSGAARAADRRRHTIPRRARTGLPSRPLWVWRELHRTPLCEGMQVTIRKLLAPLEPYAVGQIGGKVPSIIAQRPGTGRSRTDL